MSVRLCRSSDIPGCIKLWKDSFSDGDFARFYFSEVHDNNNALVFDLDGCIIGYLSSIPFVADVFQAATSCKYIYGVSVMNKFRNRGYMRKLLEYALADNSDFKFLIPSVDNLYEKFGFVKLTNKQTIIINNPIGTACECYNIEFLNSVYDCFRKKYDISVKRNEDWWNLIIKSAKLDGFRIVANEGAYAFIKDGYVSELAYVSENYRDNLKIGSCMLHLPASMSTDNFGSEDNYIALMLD